MNRPIFTPKRFRPQQHEWSRYHTQRDSHSPLRQHIDSTDYAKQINALTQLVEEIARELKKIPKPPLAPFGFYPFRIYMTPPLFRPSQESGSFNPYSSWRTIKVRSGCVLNNTIDPDSSSLVYGTDEVQFPDKNSLPNPITKGDFIVPLSASKYYVWIEGVTDPTASYHLRHGLDPKTANTQSGEGYPAGNPSPTWTNFPLASSNNWMVGYCDSLSSASVSQLIVRQFIRQDIITTAGSFITASACDGQIYFINAFKSGSS